VVKCCSVVMFFWFSFIVLFIVVCFVYFCLILWVMYYYVYVFLLLCLCIFIVMFMYSYCNVYVFLLLYLCIFIVMFMYSYCYVYVFLLSCLCIHIDKYALFCIFFGNWHSPATLTEVCPCFFLSCKANARAYLTKTEHGPHSS
jgi:hypothetical protein